MIVQPEKGTPDAIGMNDKAQPPLHLDLIDDRPVMLKMPDVGIEAKCEAVTSTLGNLITD